jgi:hypothetical protein
VTCIGEFSVGSTTLTQTNGGDKASLLSITSLPTKGLLSHITGRHHHELAHLYVGDIAIGSRPTVDDDSKSHKAKTALNYLV